jgi:N-carbamoylputrescine amidase
MTEITLAATQMSCDWDTEGNIDQAEELIREAAAEGADMILIQELFETPYFPKQHDSDYFEYARPVDEHPVVQRFQALAEELGVVLPASFFERANNAKYNSVAVIDADGTNLGTYRKTHIPHSEDYGEKYFFNPGDKGFKVWDTAYGTIGVGICWDQWFPEAARCLALQGADVLFYPTAIGATPGEEEDSKDSWQRCMQGHSVANSVPVVASNRIGLEQDGDTEIDFYGSSFITDPDGEIIAEADRESRSVITASLDLSKSRWQRESLFRDRRPEMYETLLTQDGSTKRVPTQPLSPQHENAD